VDRRSLFFLVSVGALAGCGRRRAGVTTLPSPAGSAAASSSDAAASPPVGRAAVAADYRWFAAERDLTKGFCFTWVHGLGPQQVLDRLRGTELERVTWGQLVGSGDGQVAGADRFFFGVARVQDWSLIVEDAGALGVTDALARPLSAGTRLVSHYRGSDGRGRFLLLADQEVELDFDPLEPNRRAGSRARELAPILAAAGFGGVRGTDIAAGVATEAAFALAERITGIAMTLDLLTTKTYLLATVPLPLAGAR
jgi:uncharacterized protein DUF6461